MGGTQVSKRNGSSGDCIKWNKRLLDSAPAPKRLSWDKLEVLNNARLIVTNDEKIYVVLIKEGYPSDGPKPTSPSFRTTLLSVDIHELTESDDIQKKLAEFSSTKVDLQSQSQIMDHFGEMNSIPKKFDVKLDLERMKEHATELSDAIKAHDVAKIEEICTSTS